MTDSRDGLAKSLVAVALGAQAVQEGFPGRISSPDLQPRTDDLIWPAGLALHRIVAAGINGEDLVALARYLRVRAIADALAAIDNSGRWGIFDRQTNEPLWETDLDFWYEANLDQDD